MYRIMVISDTHRHLEHILRVLDNIKEFNMIIHLGDNVADAKQLQRAYPWAETLAVQGNNDLVSPYAPMEICREIEGVKFFITHGHKYGVKHGYERIIYRAMENEAQVLLFGHTHIPLETREEGMVVLNPGGYNSYKKQIGIVEIENGRAKACLYPCL